MSPKPANPKPPKEIEPEYTWGETPGGQPRIVWEHSARPLWAQSVPERDGVLLMELERLLFRRASTGEKLWEQPAKAMPDELACDSRGVVLGSGQTLIEIDPESGAQRWRQRPGGPVTGVAVDADTVYASTRGPLFALDRRTGQVRWRSPCSWEPELHPHPEAGLLVVDDPETEAIQAYSAANGARRWEFSAEGQPVVAGPLAAGVLTVSAHEAGVAAVDAESGEVRWRLESEGAFEAPGVAHGDRLFFTDGTIHAVDAATGERVWHRALADEEEKVFSLRLDRGTLFAETW
ncbi:MAG TPA: PQQ-binding-like beta-propeller repeat protein, partial [Armatimonadota bacterium]|nr:PQQ-binding-like beta-propeller repeat protein [Armatimonadota bacterium]